MKPPSEPATATDAELTKSGRPGAVLSDAQLEEAKEYNRRQFQCDLADRVLDLTYLTAATFLVAVPLDRYLQTWSGLQSMSARLLSMYFVITLIHMAVSFPLSYFSGHVLEHRYKLSRQSFGRWLRRYVKRNLLTLIIGPLTTLGLYWIIWTAGSHWWLMAALAYFVLGIVLGQLAPVVILPLFHKIERLNDTQLNERFAKISAGTGLSIEGVYRMVMSDETAKANAMLAGLGTTRRVIMGDTLLDGFSPDEVDVIFAHEVGHHVHHHVPKLIVAGLLQSVVGFYICDWLITLWVNRIDGQMLHAQLPVHTLPLLTLVTTAFFMLVEPLQNMISRHFERQADTYALRRTGLVEAFRSAFVKLAKLNKADPDPHPWEVFLFHSHPSIGERLALSKRVTGGQLDRR